jgi:hypothetical protein
LQVFSRDFSSIYENLIRILALHPPPACVLLRCPDGVNCAIPVAKKRQKIQLQEAVDTELDMRKIISGLSREVAALATASRVGFFILGLVHWLDRSKIIGSP